MAHDSEDRALGLAQPVRSPNDCAYWDAGDLLSEQRRQFDVRRGCRLCWNLCPAFLALFDLTDGVDGDLSKLGREEYLLVEDGSCTQLMRPRARCPSSPPAPSTTTSLTPPRRVCGCSSITTSRWSCPYSSAVGVPLMDVGGMKGARKKMSFDLFRLSHLVGLSGQ